ncbi:MAG: hypothetical protein ACD_5C00021G0001 [uncultured bacterium]|nr:MAG: hypothetical protein ACD_5C00021G0001 [uncultured bacterium]
MENLGTIVIGGNSELVKNFSPSFRGQSAYNFYKKCIDAFLQYRSEIEISNNPREVRLVLTSLRELHAINGLEFKLKDWEDVDLDVTNKLAISAGLDLVNHEVALNINAQKFFHCRLFEWDVRIKPVTTRILNDFLCGMDGFYIEEFSKYWGGNQPRRVTMEVSRGLYKDCFHQCMFIPSNHVSNHDCPLIYAKKEVIK